jgi:hypothetical protein
MSKEEALDPEPYEPPVVLETYAIAELLATAALTSTTA